MYEIIKHLLDRNEEQEKKIKAIKWGLLIAGAATAIGVGVAVFENSKKHPHFKKRHIEMEEVGDYRLPKNRTRKIKVERED